MNMKKILKEMIINTFIGEKIYFNQSACDKCFLILNQNVAFFIPRKYIYFKDDVFYKFSDYQVKNYINESASTLNVKLNKTDIVIKKDILEFTDGKHKFYINKKLLSYFNKDFELKGVSPFNPIYVFEKDELVGVVMPCIIR